MPRRWLFFLLLMSMPLGLSGCVASQAIEAAAEQAAMANDPILSPTPTLAAAPTMALNLPNQGPAPELANDTWINSEPLRLADLRGNVVIVEFWTYG